MRIEMTGELGAGAERLAALADSEQRAGRFDPFALDPKLLLLCGRLMNLAGAPRSTLDDFMADVTSAVGGPPGSPGEFVGERLLLAGAGHLPGPPSTPRPLPAGDRPAYEALRLDPEQLRKLCAAVASATQYGLARPAGEPGFRRDLSHALALVLLQSLRAYDLALASVILRTLAHMGVRNSGEVRLAVDHLVNQQRPDGAIGYFAIEREHMAADGHAPTALELDLPVTASAVWALAEIWGVSVFAWLARPPRPPR
jgi:hypothetical protein